MATFSASTRSQSNGHGPDRSFSNGNGPPSFERPEGEMHWWNLV